MSTIILETERLRLAAWDDRAVDELVAMHANPDVQRYLDPNGGTWSREKAAVRLGEWRDEHQEFGLGKHRLSRREDDSFVGRAGFSVFGDDGPEIGYSLARAHWGKGYATEIATALRDWLFATRNEPHFVAFAHRDNAASQRVLDKIGMRFTHEGDVVGMPHRFYILERPQ